MDPRLCQHSPSAVLPFILENEALDAFACLWSKSLDIYFSSSTIRWLENCEALPLRECLELCGR